MKYLSNFAFNKSLSVFIPFRVENPIKFSPNCLQIRWRMRRWAPKNPSKVFYVPERKKQDPEERKLLLKWVQNYNTDYKSIRRLFKQLVSKSESSANVQINTEQQEDDLSRRIKENLKWNEETKVLRLQFQEKLMEQNKIDHLEEDHRQTGKKIQKAVIAERFATSEALAAGNFIDESNLVEQIEKALNTRDDFNFAIDTSGTKVETPVTTLLNGNDESQEKVT